MRRRWTTTTLAFAALCWNVAVNGQPGTGEFEIREGYLSASVRELVSGYGWSLVWEAEEDRRIDFPFAVVNQSLEGALTSILEGYKGQFVADLYRKNQVVVINTPPPRVAVDLPGAESQLADSEPVGLSSRGELPPDPAVASAASQAQASQVASTAEAAE